MEDKEPVTLGLQYEDIADYVFTSLVDLGYAPTSDEVLDIADFVTDLFLTFANALDIPMVILEDDDWEEE